MNMANVNNQQDDEHSCMDGPFSKLADQAGDLVFVGSVTPHTDRGEIIQSLDQTADQDTSFTMGQMLIDVREEPAAAQTQHVLDRLTDVLSAYGLERTSLLRLRIFVADRHDVAVVRRVTERYLRGHAPALSIVLVSSEGLNDAIRVYLDAVAYAGDEQVEVIDAGPAGTATRGGDYVFVPCTDGTEPSTDQPELPDRLANLRFSTRTEVDIRDQTWTLFRRVDTLLAAAGGSLRNILKVNGWLGLPMRYYGPAVLVRDHIATGGTDELQASTGLAIAGLPDENAKIGFEAVAYVPNDAEQNKQINLPSADIAGYYVGAVKGGGLVFTCGEVPIDGANGRLIDACPKLEDDGSQLNRGHVASDRGMRAKAWYVYRLHEQYLKAYDLGLTDVVHQVVYLKNAEEMATVERVASMFFGAVLPPTTFVPIVDTSPFSDAALEIEVVARA